MVPEKLVSYHTRRNAIISFLTGAIFNFLSMVYVISVYFIVGEYVVLERNPEKYRGYFNYTVKSKGSIRSPWQWYLSSYHLLLSILYIYFMCVAIGWANKFNEQK